MAGRKLPRAFGPRNDPAHTNGAGVASGLVVSPAWARAAPSLGTALPAFERAQRSGPRPSAPRERGARTRACERRRGGQAPDDRARHEKAWQTGGSGLTRVGRVPRRSLLPPSLVSRFSALGLALGVVALTTPRSSFAQAGAGGAPADEPEKPPAAPPPAAKPPSAEPAPAAPPAEGAEAPPTLQSPAAPPAETPEEAPPPRVEIPPTEAERARGLPIVRITVAGNRRVTEDDIRSYLKLRPGQPFSPEALTDDVRELYASGFFDDIEVDLTRVDEGRSEER